MKERSSVAYQRTNVGKVTKAGRLKTVAMVTDIQ